MQVVPKSSLRKRLSGPPCFELAAVVLLRFHVFTQTYPGSAPRIKDTRVNKSTIEPWFVPTRWKGTAFNLVQQTSARYMQPVMPLQSGRKQWLESWDQSMSLAQATHLGGDCGRRRLWQVTFAHDSSHCVVDKQQDSSWRGGTARLLAEPIGIQAAAQTRLNSFPNLCFHATANGVAGKFGGGRFMMVGDLVGFPRSSPWKRPLPVWQRNVEWNQSLKPPASEGRRASSLVGHFRWFVPEEQMVSETHSIFLHDIRSESVSQSISMQIACLRMKMEHCREELGPMRRLDMVHLHGPRRLQTFEPCLMARNCVSMDWTQEKIHLHCDKRASFQKR